MALLASKSRSSMIPEVLAVLDGHLSASLGWGSFALPICFSCLFGFTCALYLGPAGSEKTLKCRTWSRSCCLGWEIGNKTFGGFKSAKVVFQKDRLLASFG